MSKPQNNYRQLQARANADNSADIWMYGVITDERASDSDITALDVVAAINQYPDAKSLTIHLNSNGGDLFEGISIYNTLRDCGKRVTIIGEGIVASIASVIAMAADHFAMAENSKLMVHNPLILMRGSFNKHDLNNMADDLAQMDDLIIRAYVEKTRLSSAEVVGLLDGANGKGTFLSPQEALSMGFCDSIIPSKRMVAMVQPAAFRCRGHTVKIDYNAPKLTDSVSGATNGGKKMPGKKKPNVFRRGKIKAELFPIECPHCGSMMELDSASGIVTLNPAEDATVAVPMEIEARRRIDRFRNELFTIECPSCGGEFEWDSDPGPGVSGSEDGGGISPTEPIMQAKRGEKTKRQAKVIAARPTRIKMQTETVPITCTECGEEFEIDIDSQIEQADVECPGCGTILSVDASNVGSGDDGNTGNDGGGTPAPANNESDIVAFRNGVVAERERITLLNERKAAFPEYTTAIDGFIKNGTSISSASNWIFKAIAAKSQKPVGNVQYQAAARRDAQVLNKLGGAKGVDAKENQAAEDFNSLAARRGTLKNG